MDYIAVLEYEHLDNGMFLNAFAQALSKKQSRGIILHGDSEYTERIIQTGVMREEATVRAMKDLNHRLVALFADQGISTIAVNGYQKSLIRISGNELSIDTGQLKKFPSQPVLLISALAFNPEGIVQPVPLPDLARTLQTALNIEKEITTFSIHEESEVIADKRFPVTVNTDEPDEEFKLKHVPENFRKAGFPVQITTTQRFV